MLSLTISYSSYSKCIHHQFYGFECLILNGYKVAAVYNLQTQIFEKEHFKETMKYSTVIKRVMRRLYEIYCKYRDIDTNIKNAPYLRIIRYINMYYEIIV